MCFVFFMFCVFSYPFILFSFRFRALYYLQGMAGVKTTNTCKYLFTNLWYPLFVDLFVTGWIFSYFHQNIQFLAGKIINKIWTLNLSLLHKIFLFLFNKYYCQDKIWFKQIFPFVSWKALFKDFCFYRILWNFKTIFSKILQIGWKRWEPKRLRIWANWCPKRESCIECRVRYFKLVVCRTM